MSWKSEESGPFRWSHSGIYTWLNVDKSFARSLSVVLLNGQPQRVAKGMSDKVQEGTICRVNGVGD